MTDKLESIIDAAKQSSTARSRRTIELIVSVCKEQESRNSADFSIATIGKLCESKGGISAQAIRNDKSGRYRAIIEGFQYKNPHKTRRKKVATEDWIDRISDRNARWLARDLEAKLKDTQSKLQLVQETMPTIVINDPSNQSSQKFYPNPSLSELEINALKDFISPKNLSCHGLEVTEYGELSNSKGELMSKPGFIDAIEKVLRF